ncbi:MAG: hypothetical protein J6U39_04660, partial [Clostridia bacterium]|nr:hypothetical protein [Clostridia bacterium]
MKAKIITVSVCLVFIIIASVFGSIIHLFPSSTMGSAENDASITSIEDLNKMLSNFDTARKTCYLTDLSQSTANYTSASFTEEYYEHMVSMSTETVLTQTTKYYYNAGAIHASCSGIYVKEIGDDSFKSSFEYEYYLGYKEAYLVFTSFSMGYSLGKETAESEKMETENKKQAKCIQKYLNKWIDLCNYDDI